MKLKYVIDKKYDKQFVGMSSKIVRDNFDDIYKNKGNSLFKPLTFNNWRSFLIFSW